MIVLVILVVAAAAGGYLIGRWSVALVAAAVWCLNFLGRAAGWWGSGVGDGWPFLLAVGALLAAAGAAAGVAARRGLRRTAS